MWKDTTSNNLWVASRLVCNAGLEGEISDNNNRVHLGEEEKSFDGKRF